MALFGFLLSKLLIMELACLVILSNDIGILAADTEETFRKSIEDVSMQLNALHRSQRARTT